MADRPGAPLLALTVGDPAGIGPELVRACLKPGVLREPMRLLVIGPLSECPRAADTGAGLDFSVPHGSDPAELLETGADRLWLDVAVDEPWVLGRAQASSGRVALDALRIGAELAQAGLVDALVTAPVSKEALHLAGEPVEGQTQLLARWADAPRVQMLAVADRLRVLLLTRHMPLRDALESITEERVFEHLGLLHRGLRSFGFKAPRLALAGLNPHAGESGLLGREELDVLAPALERAREAGWDVQGPESPDTVFLRAFQGAFDGVLALYHDQAFIPAKLAAPKRGLTVLLELPYLRVSPAHGTAFDIAGTGRADPTNLACALEQAARWAPAFRGYSRSGGAGSSGAK